MKTATQRYVCRATEDFRCEINGEPVEVRAGEIFDSEHEVVQANRTRFEWQPVRYDVEQASAAPGERRER